MWRYFWKGALHGLILGTVGCALVTSQLYRSVPAKVVAEVTVQRHVQKIFPAPEPATP